MDTAKLRKFARFARRALIEQVAAKLEAVRADGSASQREHPAAFKKLEVSIDRHGADEVIETVAYVWFNRFTALRFLDVNELNAVRVVSPLPGQFQPEILADAKAGKIDEQLVPEATRRKVRDLLEGLTPGHDPQAEAYRLLLVAICNSWQATMPFLFEPIDDYTELLLPTDLLSNASILAYLREAMTPDTCQGVEIIGWLYQFYVSEKKDQVFAGLKKNQKIEAENIPAATQLFTPHWIVRYLVENSLGRLWRLNRPGSKLAERMDYYIAPEEPETDFLKITRPEEIKVCDPACGSGHMLTYAFDLLYAIYEEEGYDPAEIPALILTHNLTGVEIDDRAGALAAFALMMKAAARLGRRRFLRMAVNSGSGPNICVLQKVAFTDAEMQDVAAVVGENLFTDELRETLGQFEQAKNFGSLIVPKLRDPTEALRVVEVRDFGSDLLRSEVQARVIAVLRMAEALSPRYHVVVANPPYAGAKGLNGRLGVFSKENYKLSNADLFSMFIERSEGLAVSGGYFSLIVLPSWMFLSSFESLRVTMLRNNSLLNLCHMGRGIFGIDWGSSAFCFLKGKGLHLKTDFFRPHKRNFQYIPPEKIRDIFLAAKNDRGYIFDFSTVGNDADDKEDQTGQRIYYQIEADKFLLIPGSPFAYWLGEPFLTLFQRTKPVGSVAEPKAGLSTGDNPRFQRSWHEVSLLNIGFDASSSEETLGRSEKWYPCNSGGDFRKWYGNNEIIVNWENDGRELRNFKDDNGKLRSALRNIRFFFKPGVTWNKISAGSFAARVKDSGYVFDDTGRSAFCNTASERKTLLATMCSSVTNSVLRVLNPSMSFTSGDVANIPFPLQPLSSLDEIVDTAIRLTKSDWDAYETSWDFTTLPLLVPEHRGETLKESYTILRAHWQSMTDEMQRLEEENNRIFIDAYGLQDELTPEVPIKEITLTCNPAYRYGVKGSEEGREARLRADTMAEFLHYAVGCMFGRYSLDAPGLILANQGERLEDFLARIPEPSFMPDEDNVIPVLDGDWFPDDITERFRLFLRVTFGETQFQENLRYIKDALGKDIRKYFTKDFYADHVKRYKKRPIYWMFSSPKGTFNALIYMHRYRPDMVSVLLNDYLREFISKLEGERGRLEKLSDDPSASQGQRTRALKDMDLIARQVGELNEWERDVVFPLAQQKIEIDLDDGVKANYPKFGAALKKIPGLEAKND